MTEPYYADDSVTLHHGDCLDVLRELPDASVDAVCTDPPYALEFMGKTWDGWSTPAAFQEWCGLWAAECQRVLKPGGHLLAFGGSRTWHRLAAAIEDAGFEIRDSIAWLYGSGFSKGGLLGNRSGVLWCECGADDRPPSGAAGRGAPHQSGPGGQPAGESGPVSGSHVALDDGALRGRAECPRCGGLDPAFRGFSTTLKPAFEPIVVGRKPLDGTVAANVLAHGTGALNIDGCRLSPLTPDEVARSGKSTKGMFGLNSIDWKSDAREHAGRWPANVVLDDTQAAELDRQSGTLKSGSRAAGTYGLMGYMGADEADMPAVQGDQGGASRFFPTFRYEAKAPTSERPRVDGIAHPTVKPLDLMRWLVRLVTPPGGVVLEPFVGSGTTAEACVLEGFRCIAIEREAEYLPLIVSRLSKPLQLGLDLGVGA